jgi:hypothetical protein
LLRDYAGFPVLWLTFTTSVKTLRSPAAAVFATVGVAMNLTTAFAFFFFVVGFALTIVHVATSPTQDVGAVGWTTPDLCPTTRVVHVHWFAKSSD